MTNQFLVIDSRSSHLEWLADDVVLPHDGVLVYPDQKIHVEWVPSSARLTELELTDKILYVRVVEIPVFIWEGESLSSESSSS
tara:strand:- start:1650 stop:1898 length:249 start_codon:yes stop_codon:yes gene_type:complete